MSNAVPCDLADRVDRTLRRFGTKRACWLTFFVRLPAERRDEALGRLEQIGVEADRTDAPGRHLHARLLTNARASEICRAIDRVCRICTDVGAQLLAADLDEDAAMGNAAQIVNLFCTP